MVWTWLAIQVMPWKIYVGCRHPNPLFVHGRRYEVGDGHLVPGSGVVLQDGGAAGGGRPLSTDIAGYAIPTAGANGQGNAMYALPANSQC